MTDLETQLRRALRVSQDPGGYAPPGYPVRGCDESALDVAGIVARGRRLRWRRRAVAVGGSLCVAAAMFGAVTGIGKLATPSVHPAQHVVGPARSVPAPSPSRPVSSPSPIASPTAIATAAASSPATPTPISTVTPGAQPAATPVSTSGPQPTATPTPSPSQ
ncbi:MAG: hypothetical protein JWM19_3528 [Actinomycetia bacterium]|nr:hypothetical protein [Actinomycetes bacterium]